MNLKQPIHVLAVLVLLTLPLGTACQSEGKENPSWLNDIRPIVVARCVQCHTHPSIAGAPNDFRLDVYRNTMQLDGRVMRGAETMAKFMAARAGTEGSMPPDHHLHDGDRDTFENWYQGVGDQAKLGNKADNHPPTIRLTKSLPVADTSTIHINYQILDPDGDIVHGQLYIGDQMVADDLHFGKGVVKFDPSHWPNGNYDISARFSDGTAAPAINNTRGFITQYPFTITLDSLRITHADNNIAPSVKLQTIHLTKDGNEIPVPLHDQLYSDAQSPVPFVVEFKDENATDTFQLEVIAVRGQEKIVVLANAAATSPHAFRWDTTAVPEGPGWQLEVRVSDSSDAETLIQSEVIRISHQSTALRFDDIKAMLASRCGLCHYSPSKGESKFVPYLGFSLNVDRNDENFVYEKIRLLRGDLYRRAVLEMNMPPRSADTLVSPTPFSDSDRTMLSEYLLGGTPL